MFYLIVLLLFRIDQGVILNMNQQQIWQQAQVLANINDLPQPGVEVKKLEQVVGLADKERYVVYLDPLAFTAPIAGFPEFILTHEFIHLALLKKGIDENDHHCWMAVNRIQTKIAQWVIQNYLPYNRNPNHPLLQGADWWEGEHLCKSGLSDNLRK